VAIISNIRERKRFVRFAVVGAIGFAVDFLSFNLFRSGFGISPEISSILSFLVAVTSNFIWNRYWTYPDSRSKPVIGQLVQFITVNVFGLGIRTGIFILIKQPLVSIFENISISLPLESYVLGENLALAIVVVIVMFWNFFVNRYWTYNDVD
jgi:putative flippase GtrA